MKLYPVFNHYGVEMYEGVKV